jgi:hypothetical protein
MLMMAALSAGCGATGGSPAVIEPEADQALRTTSGGSPAVIEPQADQALRDISGGSPAVIEPQADQALRAMCTTLESAKAFHFRVAATVDEMSPSGQMVQVHRETTVLVRRPDAIAAQTRSDKGQWSLWYGGKTLSVLREDRNEYTTIQVPATIDKMLDFLFQEHELTIPLADLLFQDPYRALTENVQTGVSLGLHSVGGRPCHHLLFTQERVDWQVWIDSGEKPLPLKVVITHKNKPDQPQYTAELSDWDLAAAAPDAAFSFKVPVGAKAVDMSELRREEGQ